jgi:dihydroorotase
MNLLLPRGHDLHVHFRSYDSKLFPNVIGYTARRFSSALVMPNTSPNPILTGADADAYRHAILKVADDQGITGFTPLMTIQITESTTPKTIADAHTSGVVAGKVYPLGVTTNSGNGLTIPSLMRKHDVWQAMADVGMVLCLHGERPFSANEFCLQAEVSFLPTLQWLSKTFCLLKIVMEHVTTAEAVEEVLRLPNVYATITAHHLRLTLNDVIGGNLDPHAFCKPVAKTPEDRNALLLAATCGSDKIFFGSDSAPHTIESKHLSGCAGIFSAPHALECLAEVFEDEGKLDNLPKFLTAGAPVYNLPASTETITLERKEQEVPKVLHQVRPYRAGETLRWKVV